MEYWIHEDGYVDFADGDIGDYNHEGIVIRDVQNSIVNNLISKYDIPPPKYGRWDDQEYVDFPEFENALAQAYANELISKYPAKTKAIQAQLNNDPDKFALTAANRAGIKANEWATAQGHGDARDFAMQNWGWKTYRDENIDTWFLKSNDVKAIISGIDEISEQEGWSDKKLSKMRFTINVFSTRKNFYVSYEQLKNPKPRMQQQLPSFDYLTQQANKQVRNMDIKNLHPYYQNITSPLGDSVISFKQFIIEHSSEDNINDAYGTLRDFGEEWGYPIPNKKDFIKLVQSLPVRKLMPSKIKINNTSAKPELIGKGLSHLVSGLADIGDGRQYSAIDSVRYHADQLKQGMDQPVIMIKQNDAYFTLLDGDHRLVAAYLTNTPFNAIIIPINDTYKGDYNGKSN